MGTEEVAQGLAVKVSGRLLCPLCLDRLPGDAKVMVNQMRALRGMAATTYRFHSGRHPGLPLYTFTTATLVLTHLRHQAHGEPFEAPALPPPGSRPRMPSATEAARGDRTGWMAVAGVSILVITGVIWLLVPAAKQPPPPQAPQHAAPPVAPVQPVPDPTPAQQPAERSAATILTELEERLRRQPDEARSIADEAELLRDRLEPRAVALRNRADTLVAEALAVHEARRAAQPPPLPPPDVPKPIVLPVEPPAPVMVPAPAPEPAPVVVQPKPEPPVVAPVPDPVKPVKPAAAGDGPSTAEVTVIWPKGARALVEPDGLPARREIPWPWPTGEAIYGGALDARLKPRRLALELRLPGTSPIGGATVVIHPGKADRQAVSASWTDGTTSTPAITVALDGLRWQTVAIPATGSDALDPEQIRLRLEDLKDLSDQRPFLVAGASVRWDAAPNLADHPLRLPLLLPSAFETADGWLRFRKLLLSKTSKLLEDRSFSFVRTKILLPFPRDQATDFRHAVRVQLKEQLKVDALAKGNPDEIPSAAAEFLNPQTGWPAVMDDLDRYSATAFGWRALAWGNDDDLGKRVEIVIAKLLREDRKLRRPAAVPILIIGDVDRATLAERAVIDQRWEAIAQRIAGLGIPVIDLRSAQAENTTKEVELMSARILFDALRQLDWLLKP